jgi:hypothetical protein
MPRLGDTFPCPDLLDEFHDLDKDLNDGPEDDEDYEEEEDKCVAA